MKAIKGTLKALIFLAAIAVLFVAISAKTAERTFEDLKTAENFTDVDYYSMQEYSDENSSAVMAALKSGESNNLVALLTGGADLEGARAVMGYADWKDADFENAVAMGAGSLSPAPDKNGFYDISERFFVDAGGARYVIFVETLTSRWGRTNEGVSSVAVTSYEHFDAIDYAWNGKDDDETARAGTLFWTGNQAEGDEPDY